MGPFRGRLIITAGLLLFSASPALAAVCDQQRPDWQPSDGPVSAFGELLHLATSLPGLAIAGAFVLALTRGGKWDWPVATTLPAIIAIASYVGANSTINRAAVEEGCAGPAGLSVGLCLLLSAIAGWQSYRTRQIAIPD